MKTCINKARLYNWYLDYGMIITLQTRDSVITQSSAKEPRSVLISSPKLKEELVIIFKWGY